MKGNRYSEEKILAILKDGEQQGQVVSEVCRRHGISEPTYYRWKAKYGGLERSELTRLRQLEAENSKLKRLVADLTLDNLALKDVVGKKW